MIVGAATLLMVLSWTQQQLQEEQYPFRHRCIGQYCRKRGTDFICFPPPPGGHAVCDVMFIHVREASSPRSLQNAQVERQYNTQHIT